MKSQLIRAGIIFKLVAITMVLMSYSCSKDDNDAQTGDDYYVKYVLKGNGSYGHISNFSVRTPQGTFNHNGIQVRSWSQTYGPVNKGFKCRVQIGNYINGAPKIEIHVAKNAEPFTLKVSITGNSATYTIQ